MENAEVVERIEYVKEEKPPCEDKGVWTGEPEYDTQLAIRLFRPPQLKGRVTLIATVCIRFQRFNFF